MADAAAVEVARVDEAAVGMGGGKSSSSLVFIAVFVVVTLSICKLPVVPVLYISRMYV